MWSGTRYRGQEVRLGDRHNREDEGMQRSMVLKGMKRVWNEKFIKRCRAIIKHCMQDKGNEAEMV